VDAVRVSLGVYIHKVRVRPGACLWMVILPLQWTARIECTFHFKN